MAGSIAGEAHSLSNVKVALRGSLQLAVLSGKRGLHIAQGCHVLAFGHKAVELGHLLGIHFRTLSH